MCRFCNFASNDLLQCVYALAIGVEGVHEMHFRDFYFRGSDEIGLWICLECDIQVEIESMICNRYSRHAEIEVQKNGRGK